MRHKFRLSIGLIVAVISFANMHAQNSLVGPIIVGMPVGARQITIQDIGANQVWELPINSGGYTPFYNWSPDGCRILLRGSMWDIVSLSDSSIQSIESSFPISHISASIGQPIWHPDAETLVFSINKQLNFNPTSYYLYNVVSGETQIAFTSEHAGHALRWLTSADLLLEVQGDLFVWNQSTLGVEPYVSEFIYPLYGVWDIPAYFTESFLALNEPNSIKVKYFDMRTYQEALNNPQEYVEIYGSTENVEPISGFDIYFADTGLTTNVDTNSQFVQSIVISPTEQKIAVTTYSPTAVDNLGRIYVYDVVSETLSTIGTFASMYDIEYGAYLPAWSPDERFLTFFTPNGYIVYDIQDGSIIQLDERFNHYYLNLSWSPEMDYDEQQCLLE